MLFCWGFDKVGVEAKQIIQEISSYPKTKVVYKYLVKGVKNPSKKLIHGATKGIKPLVKECLQIQELILKIFYDQSSPNYDYSCEIGSLRLSDIPEIVDKEILLKNKTLTGRGKGKDLASRRYYHIYCLIENQVRNCMIDHVQRKHDCHGGVDVYQVHDAILFNNTKVSGDSELIDHVKDCLGLKLISSNKKISYSSNNPSINVIK